ncbi:MAG: PCRF domain-containing protein, partial [Chloroflexota bacterium]
MRSYVSAWPRSRCVFDLPTKVKQIARLEEESSDLTFWDDSQAAQVVMRRLTTLQEEVGFWRDFSVQLNDNFEMLELAREENDAATQDEVTEELTQLKADLDKQEFELMFSGPYDDRPALLSVNAGEGGTDSQDWAE